MNAGSARAATGEVSGAESSPTRVRIFYQTDPAGPVLGGIDSFIRGLIGASPPDIRFSVVGVTTDPDRRPVGRWTTIRVADRLLEFFPVAHNRQVSKRLRVPLAARLAAGILRYRRACTADCDILDVHRIEPLAPLYRDGRPVNLFMHQEMGVIRNQSSDIMWRHAPGAYFALERLLLPRCAQVFCVHSGAVSAYRDGYPEMRDRVHFLPTWLDPKVFYDVGDVQRAELRRRVKSELGLADCKQLLVSVGRLDRQKDPLLLLESFAVALNTLSHARLVIIGDGAMRDVIRKRAMQPDLAGKVVLAGLRGPTEIAAALRSADAFVLTSAYEGMPICVLEALGCGTPVITTRVGEVAMVVKDGINGRIVDDRSPSAIGRAIVDLLSDSRSRRGSPCTAAVEKYVPERILAPVYATYRTLATDGAASFAAADGRL